MIRNILYLDEEKLYSMSSQIFEGITEYLLNEVTSTKEDSNEQKGPVGSGRVLADALRLSERSTEKRFLHDHSLALFENRLNELDLIQAIADGDLESVNGATNKAFIRVSAPATFSDAKKIRSIIDSFNEIGEALAHVSNFNEINNLRIQIRDASNSGLKPSGELRKLEREISNIPELAKKLGLHQDPRFLKDLSRVTHFGFSDHLELEQSIGSRLYSSCLRREFLREPEDMLVRKYSRNTEKSFVVLGVVTQSSVAARTAPDEIETGMNMKAAVRVLVSHIANIESTLSGKGENEVVIDPIAVYVTL